MISQITRRIFIGEQNDALNAEALQSHEINCVINLREKSVPEEKTLLRKLGIHYEHVPIPREGTKSMVAFKKSLGLATVILDEMLDDDQQHKVLVHCEAGIDRAPFVVALWLFSVGDLELSQAYAIIKQRRKHIMEHYEWL